eukprot:m.87431 g.87431  ORF g.87431 m.87431 type:complete len:166 (+) comp8317_c0_seq1:510-1007(+)
MRLLATPSITTLIRALLAIVRGMNRASHIVCADCQGTICSLSQVFALVPTGAQGTYVNPHGAIHRTITLRGVDGGDLRLVGRYCAESSWFPGYAWRIAHCKGCGAHLGWRFRPAEPGQELDPPYFYGLTMSALLLDSASDEWVSRLLADTLHVDDAVAASRTESS